jgi:nucleotide-binding universal stress UspA family protein
MSIKAIVTFASGEPRDAQSLSFAAHLAHLHQAAVRVVPGAANLGGDLINFGLAMGARLSLQEAQALAQADRRARVAIQQACVLACQEADIPYGQDGAPGPVIEPTDLTPWLTLARCVGLSDLVVIGHGVVDPGEVISEVLIRLRTALFVGRGSPDSLNGVVAIAWDGSLEACRAVRAALPFLVRARRIIALQVPSGIDPIVDASFETLTHYLALHGIAGVERETIGGEAHGPALHTAAVAHGAALLVAGAYGHSRSLEALFGGATRALLTPKAGPSLLLAH